MGPYGTSHAAGQTVSIQIESGTDPATSTAIARIVDERRQSLPPRPLPSPGVSPEHVANKHRIRAIAQALIRARRHEENAAWSACAKEAGDRLGDATELLSRSHRLDLLRELHLQIGACLSLSATPADAMPHYRTTTLLEEAQPARGDHHEEAESRRRSTHRNFGTSTWHHHHRDLPAWRDGLARRAPSAKRVAASHTGPAWLSFPFLTSISLRAADRVGPPTTGQQREARDDPRASGHASRSIRRHNRNPT